MKVSVRKLYDFVVRATTFIAKLSGFWFLSIKSLSNGTIVCHQTRIDYVVFALSLTFSLLTASIGSNETLNVKIKSTILNLGTMFLWKMTLYSIIVTKIVNFIAGRSVFNILQDFKWMDRQVLNLFF